MYICMNVCMCVLMHVYVCMYVCMHECVRILTLVFWIYLQYKCHNTKQDQDLVSKTRDKTKT